MSTTDRNGAWAALADPATDATALAVIAGTYPEFAPAIAQHPNAYPALVEWAQGTVAAQEAPSVQQAPTAFAPMQAAPYVAPEGMGQWPPAAAARSADRMTRNRTLWIVALAVYEGVPILEIVLFGGLFGTWRFDDGATLWFAVLNSWTILAIPVVAAVVAPTSVRKLIAALLGVAAFVVECISMSLVAHAAGGQLPLPAQLLFVGSSVALLFLCWAVAWPIVGAGFAALPVALFAMWVLRIVIDPWIWGLVESYFAFSLHMAPLIPNLIGNLVVGVLDTAFVIGIVLLASAWSRRSELKAAQFAVAR